MNTFFLPSYNSICRLLACWSVALVVSVSAVPAMAELVFDIEDVQVLPGQLARVGVYVSATGGEHLIAYDLTIDVGDDGFGLPTGIAAFAPSYVDDACVTCYPASDVVVTGLNALPLPLTKHYEGIFSDDALETLDLSSGPVRLFDLLLLTDANLTGSIPIVITSSSNPNRLTVVGSSGTFQQAGPNLVLLPGSITAIPEPSGFLAIGLVAAVALLVRRWRCAVADAVLGSSSSSLQAGVCRNASNAK